MWNHKFLLKIDLRLILIIFCLMGISLLVISSMTMGLEEESWFTPMVKNQIQWFVLGWVVFLFFAGLDYRKFASWSWILYLVMLVLLLGVFFTTPIQRVHRWYRIPVIGLSLQPSEIAKLIVVMCLGFFLDKKENQVHTFKSSMQILFIVGVPFFLILKQPDLGTALVLFPITFTMCYFAGVNRKILRAMGMLVLVGIVFVFMVFTNILSHDEMRPFFTSFMKDYQYERLNPATYHQKAAKISIAIGGITGSGWHKSEFSARKWLPAAHTDSVFAAFGEEFGFLGMAMLMFLFYGLIFISFQTVACAKDRYGRLLASGIAVYLAMHIIVNIAMMCGFLPISGVPLIIITYGGSSILATMAALGILQSIYTRRFMF